MKKLGAFLFILIGLSFFVQAQTIVTTNAQLKNVVLEEYTGIHCGYCPDGHARAEEMATDNPGRVVLINIHQGSFSNPAAGEPDFRTTFGDALATLAGVTGYPSGSVNRHLFPEVDAANTGLSRSAWSYVAPEILAEPSPVNIGFQSDFDTSNRQLSVDVELYYTSNSTKSTNYINIVLLENHVYGYQSDYANGTHTDYDHKHILRYMITGQFGETISTTTKGSLFTKTYAYTVPAEWNIDSCDVVVFVTESQQEIYTGFVAPAVGGSADGTTVLYIGDLGDPDDAVSKGQNGVKTSFDLTVFSALQGDENFEFTLTEENAPVGWASSFTIDGNDYVGNTTISLTGGVNKTLNINVTPDASPGFASYSLSMKSLSNPTAPERIQGVYVISGVTDLVLNNSSAWGDGSETRAKDFEKAINDGLTYASNNTHASTETKVIDLISDPSILDDIKNIYYNVGWSFPSLSDDLVTYFKTFLDKGGNLFVSGQDIAWDNFEANGYGTDATKAFVTDYLHSTYVSDGDQANGQLTAISTDAVFGTVATSSLTNKYGTNPDNGTPYFYPDQVLATASGQAIFNYNGNSSKTAAVRSRVEGYKTVFMAVSLEMVSDAGVQKEIMKLTYEWFMGMMADVEFDEAMQELAFNYPNPATSYTIAPLNGVSDGLLEVVDVNGRILDRYQYKQGEKEIRINTEKLSEGMYFYRLIEGGKFLNSRPFLVNSH
ncbi:Omp28-related outer membrane protein [Bacteroidota bacterium]